MTPNPRCHGSGRIAQPEQVAATTKPKSMTTREAIERAITALEHRIHQIETEGIPDAEARRAKGIVDLLKEGVLNDRIAKSALEAHLQTLHDF